MNPWDFMAGKLVTQAARDARLSRWGVMSVPPGFYWRYIAWYADGRPPEMPPAPQPAASESADAAFLRSIGIAP